MFVGKLSIDESTEKDFMKTEALAIIHQIKGSLFLLAAAAALHALDSNEVEIICVHYPNKNTSLEYTRV